MMFPGLLAVWRRIGDGRYFDYVTRHMDAVIGADGTIAGYDWAKYRLDDNHNA